MRLLIRADARSIPLADGSVNCCVTSPPYWGLRDYGVPGQLGLEPTPEEYVASLVTVFREVRRVLRDDGTLWLNLGDCYATSPPGNTNSGVDKWKSSTLHGAVSPTYAATLDASVGKKRNTVVGTLKPKDLVGIPWMVAFALRADGWYLRQDIIWAKPNPMPESVRDRCTKSHEYLFLLAKSARYYYDADAISEPAENAGRVLDYTGEQKNNGTDPVLQATRPKGREIVVAERRNRRSVWSVATNPYAGAHFATFPEKLIEPCILAGCPRGGIVLDPFVGSGTTCAVAIKHGRRGVGMDLSREYLHGLARARAQGQVVLDMKEAE